MKKKTELIESASFLIPIMMIGGFMDSYTFITRGGVFANNQTGNVAKLGIAISQMDMVGTIESIVPLLFAVLGSFVATRFKSISIINKSDRWEESILLSQAILFILVGLAPMSVPNIIVNSSMTFISTFMLTAFRKLDGLVCNTTISTGNLRTIGQLWSESSLKRDKLSINKAIKYTFVVLTFVIGSGLGALASVELGSYAIIVCSIVLCFQYIRLKMFSMKIQQDNR